MTKEIDKNQVKHICDLANVKLTEDEREKFAKELDDVLDYIEKLDELNTDDVEATAYPIPLRNVLREDKIEESLATDEVMKNAPKKIGKQFKVPPIMGEEE